MDTPPSSPGGSEYGFGPEEHFGFDSSGCPSRVPSNISSISSASSARLGLASRRGRLVPRLGSLSDDALLRRPDGRSRSESSPGLSEATAVRMSLRPTATRSGSETALPPMRMGSSASLAARRGLAQLNLAMDRASVSSFVPSEPGDLLDDTMSEAELDVLFAHGTAMNRSASASSSLASIPTPMLDAQSPLARALAPLASIETIREAASETQAAAAPAAAAAAAKSGDDDDDDDHHDHDDDKHESKEQEDAAAETWATAVRLRRPAGAPPPLAMSAVANARRRSSMARVFSGWKRSLSAVIGRQPRKVEPPLPMAPPSPETIAMRSRSLPAPSKQGSALSPNAKRSSFRATLFHETLTDSTVNLFALGQQQ